jgi:hypothetical protein
MDSAVNPHPTVNRSCIVVWDLLEDHKALVPVFYPGSACLEIWATRVLRSRT